MIRPGDAIGLVEQAERLWPEAESAVTAARAKLGSEASSALSQIHPMLQRPLESLLAEGQPLDRNYLSGAKQDLRIQGIFNRQADAPVDYRMNGFAGFAMNDGTRVLVGPPGSSLMPRFRLGQSEASGQAQKILRTEGGDFFYQPGGVIGDYHARNASRLLHSFSDRDDQRVVQSLDVDESGRIRTILGESGDETSPFRITTSFTNGDPRGRPLSMLEEYHGDPMQVPSFLALRQHTHFLEVRRDLASGNHTVVQIDPRTGEKQISVFDHRGNPIGLSDR